MSQFTDSLPEVFDALGRVEIKRMFGGHGVWHDGLMCALVADDSLYLKCDAQSIAHFEARALPPFMYQRRGQAATAMSYRLAPETVFEDRAEAAVWTRRAFEAALRQANAKVAAPGKKRAPKAQTSPPPPPPRPSATGPSKGRRPRS